MPQIENIQQKIETVFSDPSKLDDIITTKKNKFYEVAVPVDGATYKIYIPSKQIDRKSPNDDIRLIQARLAAKKQVEKLGKLSTESFNKKIAFEKPILQVANQRSSLFNYKIEHFGKSKARIAAASQDAKTLATFKVVLGHSMLDRIGTKLRLWNRIPTIIDGQKITVNMNSLCKNFHIDKKSLEGKDKIKNITLLLKELNQSPDNAERKKELINILSDLSGNVILDRLQ